MFLICVFTHKLCMWCGKICKIWRIDEVIEKVTTDTESGNDFLYLVNKIQRMQDEEEKIDMEAIPDHLRFKSRDWLGLDKVRVRDLQMKADLQTDRVVAESFKERFMLYNKPWLRQNIQEVFTPRTLFEFKDTIADEFRKILGPIDPEISTDHEGNKKHRKSIKELADASGDEDGLSSDETPLNTSEREYMEEQHITVKGPMGKVVRA